MAIRRLLLATGGLPTSPRRPLRAATLAKPVKEQNSAPQFGTARLSLHRNWTHRNSPSHARTESSQQALPKTPPPPLSHRAAPNNKREISTRKMTTASTRSDLDDISAVERDLKERQETFIRRERVYKLRLEELQKELGGLKQAKLGWMDGDPAMQSIREAQAAVLRHVGVVQGDTASAVQAQESDLLSRFRGRLQGVQDELAAERRKANEGAQEWILRAKALESEARSAKSRADTLDKANKRLGRENGFLTRQFESQEDDRGLLMRQLVAVKEENSKLRTDVDEKEAAAKTRGDALPPLLAPAPAPAEERTAPDADTTFKEATRKLRKLLDVEKRHLEEVEKAHESWKAQRTPLELALRDAVGVEAESVALRVGGKARASDEPGAALDAAALAGFDHGDRARAVERWLATDGVLDSLYPEDAAAAPDAYHK